MELVRWPACVMGWSVLCCAVLCCNTGIRLAGWAGSNAYTRCMRHHVPSVTVPVIVLFGLTRRGTSLARRGPRLPVAAAGWCVLTVCMVVERARMLVTRAGLSHLYAQAASRSQHAADCPPAHMYSAPRGVGPRGVDVVLAWRGVCSSGSAVAQVARKVIWALQCEECVSVVVVPLGAALWQTHTG